MENHTNYYTHRQIKRLLGLTETGGDAEITLLDIISWLRDPGGDPAWQRVLQENYPNEAWMAQRGPLAPDSRIACVVYDFFKGLSMLPLLHQGVIALTVCDFTNIQIGELLGIPHHQVVEILHGPKKKDGSGRVVRDKHGRPVSHQGAIMQLVHNMNGHTTVETEHA